MRGYYGHNGHDCRLYTQVEISIPTTDGLNSLSGIEDQAALGTTSKILKHVNPWSRYVIIYE